MLTVELIHSSLPYSPPLAAKNRLPLTLVSQVGLESPAPGLMSRANAAVLPSKLHSSLPAVPSLAEKYKTPLILMSQAGSDPSLGLMPVMRCVPAPPKPSETHNWTPCVPSSAAK